MFRYASTSDPLLVRDQVTDLLVDDGPSFVPWTRAT
jgi:hypothetical protein